MAGGYARQIRPSSTASAPLPKKKNRSNQRPPIQLLVGGCGLGELGGLARLGGHAWLLWPGAGVLVMLWCGSGSRRECLGLSLGLGLRLLTQHHAHKGLHGEQTQNLRWPQTRHNVHRRFGHKLTQARQTHF